MTQLATEAQKRAVLKYDAANTTQVHLKLNNNTDSEIIEHLKQTGNIQGYLKQLIIRDMHIPPLKYPPTRYSDELFGCPVCHHEVTPGMDACYRCGVFLEWEKQDEM